MFLTRTIRDISSVVCAFAAAAAAVAPSPVRASPTAEAAANGCPAVLTQTMPRLQDGRPQDLCEYAGKVVLAVNTASYCGYTPQYQGLERLYARYSGRGLVVLGFPSDSFRQEPKGNADIAKVCFDTYGVKFPMFAKSAVAGAQANPLFLQLSAATGTAPQWNFHKYLIDRQGRVVADFPSAVEPLDTRLTTRIEQLLAAR